MSDPVTEFVGAMFNAPSVIRQGDVMPDGKHIVGVLDTRNADPEGSDISVILDWFEELRQRAPVD